MVSSSDAMLIIPFTKKIDERDARLMALAHLLGVQCFPAPLVDFVRSGNTESSGGFAKQSFLLVNPTVFEEWVGSGGDLSAVLRMIRGRFRGVLIYGLESREFDSELIRALSGGQVIGARTLKEKASIYEVANNSHDICDTFSGLCIGPTDQANDRVLELGAGTSEVRTLISIDGWPFMCSLVDGGLTILVVGAKEVVDVDIRIEDESSECHFSKFLPQAMALRYLSGDHCWRPAGQLANVVIDDPLLRPRYGFLRFDTLLRLAERYGFFATIAFIPRNWHRTSSQVARMFLERETRLGICYHGNDHTSGEFASKDNTVLNTLLQSARQRMQKHQQRHSIHCDEVMVFPQGKFSFEAMQGLKGHNFVAAVNTVPSPINEPRHLTLRDICQPAIIRYGGFPLFLRKAPHELSVWDVAFNSFFGRPHLLVVHHDDFENVDNLVSAVESINGVYSGVRWCSLMGVVAGSYLVRVSEQGTVQVRAYSGTLRVENSTGRDARLAIEWPRVDNEDEVEQVLTDEGSPLDWTFRDGCIHVESILASGNSQSYSFVLRNQFGETTSLGALYHARAFIRRRLSEMRDNHLAGRPKVLRLAQRVQHLLSRL